MRLPVVGTISWLSFALGVVFALFVLPMLQGFWARKGSSATTVRTA